MFIFDKMRHAFVRYTVSPKTIFSRYAFSFVLVSLSLFLVNLFSNIEGARLYSLVLVASIFSAIHGGMGPAIFASISGTLALDYFIVEPLNDIFDSISSFVRILLYSSTSILSSFVVDILKRSLIELENSKDSAVRANHAKDNLVTIIAHDLKNPLGVIMGFSDLIKQKTNNEEVSRSISLIEKNASFCLELINDLQDLSSLESSEYKLDIISLNLSELLNEICLSFEPIVAKKGISLIFPVVGNNYFIKADKRLSRRVFQNLIDNAIKYSPYGSRIVVEIESGPESYSVIVTDQGPGIPQDEQVKIFTPFYRCSANKPTANEASTGLGLATVAAILKAHKVKIRVQSWEGKGSTFIVDYPKPERSVLVDHK